MIRILFVARHLIAKADDRSSSGLWSEARIAVASTASAAFVEYFLAYFLACVALGGNWKLRFRNIDGCGNETECHVTRTCNVMAYHCS